MIRTLQSVDLRTLTRFDAVIDVRSPGEFAEDRLPGAVNLPVLDDAERAEVGTIYVQQSRHLARRIGAAHVARNIARHLETALAERPAGFAPLVYCWRGGQRSGAMATVLAQVGWPVTVLDGGYRTWRRQVSARLYEEGLPLRIVLLDGGTGTAKTELLGRLAERGVQTLDLEHLAEHRGSLLGGLGRVQPSQKLFESRLLAALDALDPARPVLVEAESSKIGDRQIPPVLWRAMAAAPRIEVSAPRPARAAYLVRAYAEIIADRERLDAALARVSDRAGRKTLAVWRALAAEGAFEALAGALMEGHYDPAYARAARADARPLLGRVRLATLDPPEQDAAADRIAGLIETSPEI
jgi:tRNA 2-selenouridine synthase